MMYLSFQQAPWSSMWLVVREAGDPMALAPVVRREIHAIDPLLPLAAVQPLSRLVSEIAAQPRFTAVIFGLFASAALVLAVVGVYGLVAYGVTQRTREIGVRLALGATPSRIVRGVVRHGVGLAGAGIAIGLWAAFALSRFMEGILYDVAATDAVTYLAVAALLMGCGGGEHPAGEVGGAAGSGARLARRVARRGSRGLMLRGEAKRSSLMAPGRSRRAVSPSHFLGDAKYFRRFAL